LTTLGIRTTILAFPLPSPCPCLLPFPNTCEASVVSTRDKKNNKKWRQTVSWPTFAPPDTRELPTALKFEYSLAISSLFLGGREGAGRGGVPLWSIVICGWKF